MPVSLSLSLSLSVWTRRGSRGLTAGMGGAGPGAERQRGADPAAGDREPERVVRQVWRAMDARAITAG
eukprot:2969860-Rhodomonas_salina.1